MVEVQNHCGFDTESIIAFENVKLARAYVPVQEMDKMYAPEEGLKKGTIYPELFQPYHGRAKQDCKTCKPIVRD